MNRENVRGLVGSLPGWVRSPFALTIPLLLVVVPVVVSLLRASHFDTTLEVFPTMPPGNAAAGIDQGSAVASAGFEGSAKRWEDQGAFSAMHSTDEAHSGAGSLACVRDRRTPLRGAAASTRIVLPAQGRYSVQAWVRLPRGYSGGPPRVELEGLSGSSRVAARAGDVRVRDQWQLISSDYLVEAKDVKGLIVLRTASPLPQRGQVLHWDDVRVLRSNDASMPAPRRVNLVSNPGFEYDRSWWGDPPTFAVQRSAALAHSGRASLRSFSRRRALRDTNTAYTHVVFPRKGTYRAEAWAYVPSDAHRGQPAVFLEGFAGSTQLAQRPGDPKRRGTWQLVSTDYAISARDREGSLVLRELPGSIPPGRPDPAKKVVYWDDVRVPVRRPEPRRDALGTAAASLRAALREPQLRFEIVLGAEDKGLYDPRRVTVSRSARKGALSFIVRVAHDVPGDARSLAGPLRSALLGAATRSTLRRAQRSWQRLISKLGRSLPPGQRALLQRRANVLQRMIPVQPADVVAFPPSQPAPSATTLRARRRTQKTRQKIISRLGSDLPPRQRALVTQRAEDLQRMVGAHTGEFVVLPSGPGPEPTRPVDRVLDKLPGSFPPRVGPVWAGTAGLICALLLGGVLIVMTAVRRAAAQGP